MKHCPKCLRNWMVDGKQICPYCECELMEGKATETTIKIMTTENKSQTPETDANVDEVDSYLATRKYCHADFARSLETRLNEALKISVDRDNLHALWYGEKSKCDSLQSQLTTLKEQIRVKDEALRLVVETDDKSILELRAAGIPYDKSSVTEKARAALSPTQTTQDEL